jgi:hypothetical protein
LESIEPGPALDNRVGRAEELFRKGREVAVDFARRSDDLRPAGILDLDAHVSFTGRFAALLDVLRIGHEPVNRIDVLAVVDGQFQHV